MTARWTRWVLLCGFILLYSLPVKAQSKHFIYVQTDNGQPFYMMVDGVLKSSTASGYLILSELPDTEFEATVGFLRNEFPEQKFKLAANGSNRGYFLKNFKGDWILTDIQTADVVRSVKTAELDDEPDMVQNIETKKPEAQPVEAPKEADLFSSLLAKVVKDSSILLSGSPSGNAPAADKDGELRAKDVQAGRPATWGLPVQISKEEAAVAATEQSSQNIVDDTKKVTVSNKEEKSLEPETKKEETEVEIKTEVVRNPVESSGPLKRMLLVNEAGGMDMVYINEKSGDTVRLFMPVKPVEPEDLTITPTVITPKEQPVVIAEKTESVKDMERQARIIYNPETGTVGDDLKTKGENTIASKWINSDCKSIANEKDFVKLRKRMAGEIETLKMIDVARKSFRSKCYTTEQIRNLSYMFMDDAGRYMFFDTAYPYVSDSGQFPTLISQLKEEYYINRFKAMIHK